MLSGGGVELISCETLTGRILEDICWVVPLPSNSGNEGLGWDSLLKM